MHEDRGDLAAAAALYDRALEAHRARGNENLIGWALVGAVRVPYFRADYDACARTYDEAVVCLRATNDTQGVGWALFNYAWMSLSAGRLDKAAELAAACVDLGPSAGREPVLMAKVLDGLCRAFTGDVDGGRALWANALEEMDEGKPS